MKTATLEDLRTRLDTIIRWVEAGEDVVVEGSRPVIQEVPVDWSKSAVFQRPPDEPALDLTQDELQAFYQEMRGSY